MSALTYRVKYIHLCSVDIHTMYKACLEGCPNYPSNPDNYNQCIIIKRYTKIINYFERWIFEGFIRFITLETFNNIIHF